MRSRQVQNILRCYATGIGIKGISSAFHISRNTVRHYVRLFQDSGIPIERLLTMSDSQLQAMFVSGRVRDNQPSTRKMELDALLPEYAARLSHKGVTKQSLYNEYHASHQDGFRHSTFVLMLRQHMLQTRAIGHVEHYAGDQMYIDYAGDKLEIVDGETGEVRPVEVFVAILPCSHYTYCEAVWSQRKEDLILACENALRFYGGTPMAIVPDNLKAAVTRSDKNEPVINEEFAAFAEHYGCAVYPARVRRPKDKALVENAVKLMYRSVYKDIEGLTFGSLDSLNEAICVSLDKFNRRKMAGRHLSRWELFEQVEKDYLRPLPEQRYQMKERKSITVMRNSYVTLFKHHYSVPQEYIGKRVEVVYDADRVDIFYGLNLVTTHLRDDTPYAYTQKEGHQLPGRQGSYERDLDEVYAHAADIDNIVLNYLKEVSAQKKYLPQSFRSCRGILSLERRFGQDRLVAACACATEARRYGYNEVLDILNRGDDAAYLEKGDDIEKEDTHSPVRHKNIRGKDYYGKSVSRKTVNTSNKHSINQLNK